MSASKRQPWLDVAVVLAGCAIAWFVFLRPIFAGPADVPGDLGDARFNIYVLEHGFRWLTGREASLLSPGLFWPYPYLLAFSDTHAGTSWIYALFRFAGLDPYNAFKGWFALGYLASFVAAYHVARKFELPPLLAGAVALAFGLSLPAAVQMGHAQLVWRVGAPYCFWFSLRYAERGAPGDLFKFLIAFSAQTLINVYLGLFSLILCVLLFGATFAVHDGPSPRAWWRRFAGMAGAFRRLGRHDWPWAAGAAVALAALAIVMGFHAYVARLYGLTRTWAEISTMVPRPQSYLLLLSLDYWAPVAALLPDVPMAGEQQMFLGVPLTVLAIAGLVYVVLRWRRSPPRLRGFAICILATLVLFTMIGPFSLYWIVAQVPGFDSIRAVSRVMLILAFPVVIFIGLFLQDIAAWRTVGWIPAAAAIVIIAWQAADLWLLRKYEFASSLSRERVEILTAAAAIAPGRPLAFGTRPDDLWYNHQIDSVLAAQELGVPTLNGYSGALPPGAAMTMSCTGAQLMLQSYDVWAKEHGLRRLNDMGVDAAPIGMGECDLSRQTIVAMPTSTSGRSLNAKNARLVALSDLTVAPGDPATVSVLVTNGSPRVIHQRARHPLRLSWSTDQSPGVRYDNRIELGGDLAPGEARMVTWNVPPGTRLEDLSVSFVVEGKFWMHDLGIPPLRAVP